MDIEEYLFDVYKSNTKMYKKIYYHKNKERIKVANLKRYHKNKGEQLAGDFKIIKNEYIINFN